MKGAGVVGLAVVAAGLSGCIGAGGGNPCTGWGWLEDPFCTPVNQPTLKSKLSVFALNGTSGGTKYYTTNSAKVNYELGQSEISVETDNDLSISPGAINSKEEFDRDKISIFPVSTDGSRRLDVVGGEFDRFMGDALVFVPGTGVYTDDAVLTIRNTDGGGGTGLQYTTFGYWEADFQAGGVSGGTPPAYDAFSRFAAFGFGEHVTPIGQLPESGSATYNGDMAGVYARAFGDTVQARGILRLTANFDASSVDGLIFNISAGGESLRDVGLAVDPLSGGRFLGAASTLDAQTGQVGPSMNGIYIGDFYGPSAEEVSGAFAISGEGAALLGGFAGKR